MPNENIGAHAATYDPVMLVGPEKTLLKKRILTWKTCHSSKFWFQKKFGFEKNICPKEIFGPKENLGLKKIVSQKISLGLKQILCTQFFWVRNNF